MSQSVTILPVFPKQDCAAMPAWISANEYKDRLDDRSRFLPQIRQAGTQQGGNALFFAVSRQIMSPASMVQI
ncbi:hypothetical protein AOE01nite_02970 [Acetobacter oeni]|uniref:Uncharacterized protein n=1 Tax=Acetobacter oeni TaxID=304077 RepID=A0A511XGK0_9PROT|nr:hypothetical protein AA21952_0586 [Acetobacter oeni LMG 21952]GEN62073.1 hypothetical protein AOE01nite_02970 [Acetobacter oeni]